MQFGGDAARGFRANVRTGQTDTTETIAEIDPQSSGKWSCRISAFGTSGSVQSGGEFNVVKADNADDVHVHTVDSWTADDMYLLAPTVAYNTGTNRIEINQEAAPSRSGTLDWQLSFEAIGALNANFV